MPRKKPYTYEAIMSKSCYRCGKPAFYQWQICSDDNVYRPLCPECDMGLQHVVLSFMNVETERAAKLVNDYKRRVVRQLRRVGYKHDVPSIGYKYGG